MIILHGENIQQSRRILVEKIKYFRGEVLRLDGEKITLTDLKQAVESQSLFGKDKLIVLERIFSRPECKEKEKILQYCQEKNPPNLIIWEGEKINPKSLIRFRKAKIDLFEPSKTIFQFLDSLRPGNQRGALFLLHRCLKKESPELIFYMLSRHIRDLIIAVDLEKRGLKEFPSWKQEKLIRQGKEFGLERLLKLYRELLKIDYQQKTGETTLSLISQLDLFLFSL